MKTADIKRIADMAMAHGERIVDHYLPGGKRSGKEYVVRNPHRDDQQAGSLSIEVASGKGGDFAIGETFGDYVGMVAFALKVTMGDAAERLAHFLGIDATAVQPAPTIARKKTPATTVVMPVPKDAPPPPQAHPTRGKPSVRYPYRATDGSVLFYVYRWEATTTDRKYFSPLVWTGKDWRWQGPSVPRPLYGLHLLADRNAIVVVCEGEKAAEAAAALLPDCVCMTWMNGAQNADKADWSPLRVRHVRIWPDADDAGAKAAQTAAKGIRKAGAASVKFVCCDLFAKHKVGKSGGIVSRTSDLPKGWDAADALADGWTDATISDLFKMEGALIDDLKTDFLAEPNSAVVVADHTTDGPYVSDESGLFFIEHTRDGQVNQSRVCGPLTIPSLARDAEGAGWAPVIEFTDRDGRRRQEVIPYRLFLGQGHDGLKLLADLGLEIEPTTKALDQLRRYIVGAKPSRRARRVTTTGWHANNFVLPDGSVGDSDETLLFDGSRRANGVYATGGTLSKWQGAIGHSAVGNPMLMLVLSLSFAGPLLKPLGESGFAIHLVGDSSTGKSSALAGAGSTWGPTGEQVRSWRSTSNALEGTCALSNHTLLTLDEFRELDPKDATAVTYMLSNGKGKQRMHHAGGLREAVEWAIVILSSGELGLADHLAGTGQKAYAGQQVRFIELDSDAGAGLGMWNDAHAFAEGGKGFSDAMKKAALRYYGHAGRAFVAKCVQHYDMLPAKWRDHQHQFADHHKPDDAGGQVLRVMTAFSLIGFAGELATSWEIVPWHRGDAMAAAGAMFRKWLRDRPTSGNSEEYQILTHVRALMERSWKSRFDDWHRIETEAGGGRDGALGDLSRAPTVLEPLGFRKKDELGGYRYHVFRQRFEEEFGRKAGFKPRRVAAVLKTHGILLCSDDSTTYRDTLPNGDPRSYCILGNKLLEHGEVL
jgi:uncharacterized protein (DUF927 family)